MEACGGELKGAGARSGEAKTRTRRCTQTSSCLLWGFGIGVGVRFDVLREGPTATGKIRHRCQTGREGSPGE